MSSIVPPPQERFDPITARWLTPGGPLPDPQRDEIDPDRREPVTIVGPIPPELNVLGDAHLREGAGLVGASTTHVLRWVLVALVLLAILLGCF